MTIAFQHLGDVCQAGENEVVASSDSTTAAIIGGVVVAVVFMIITALTVIVIVVLVLRSRSGNYATAKTRFSAFILCTCARCYKLPCTEKQVMLLLLLTRLWNSPSSQRQPMSKLLS